MVLTDGQLATEKHHMHDLSGIVYSQLSSFISNETAHRFPFSLFNESKRGGGDSSVVRIGDVTDHMDRAIGRPTIKLKGTVSANNSLDISNLSLTGQHVFVLVTL